MEPITAAGLLVTDWCPARCRHCYVGSGPDRSRWMAAQDAAGHLAALQRLGVPAAGIHIGGGEPFGDFDRLITIVQAARTIGLDGIGYVETNGFWATSETVVSERLAALKAAGMIQLSISADPYHQEFVPPERVRLLWDVARQVLGPGGVRARRWKWLKSPADVAAMSEPERLDLFSYFLREYPERMSGRAAMQLAPMVERQPVKAFRSESCRAALLGSQHVHVDPEGWVYPGTCAGIVIGRATADRPLDRLLCEWRPEDSSRVAALVDGGPCALFEEALSLGFHPDPAGYADKCHLCWSIRGHLVRSGVANNSLQPAALYLTD
jgi:hypothetical protein